MYEIQTRLTCFLVAHILLGFDARVDLFKHDTAFVEELMSNGCYKDCFERVWMTAFSIPVMNIRQCGSILVSVRYICFGLFNSLSLDDAMIFSWCCSTLVSGNGLLPEGNKPLPEPVLNYCHGQHISMHVL